MNVQKLLDYPLIIKCCIRLKKNGWSKNGKTICSAVLSTFLLTKPVLLLIYNNTQKNCSKHCIPATFLCRPMYVYIFQDPLL